MSTSLYAHPLFHHLPAEAVARLDRRCVWRDHAQGRPLRLEQEGRAHVLCVLSGHLGAYLTSPGGRTMLVRMVGPGGLVGEAAALAGLRTELEVVAVTDARVVHMPAAVLREVIAEDAVLSAAMFRRLALEIARLEARLGELAYMDVRERLLEELLRRAETAPDGTGALVVSPAPPHADLAASVATHRETVTRELSRLVSQGVIRRQAGALYLQDMAGGRLAAGAYRAVAAQGRAIGAGGPARSTVR